MFTTVKLEIVCGHLESTDQNTILALHPYNMDPGSQIRIPYLHYTPTTWILDDRDNVSLLTRDGRYWKCTRMIIVKRIIMIIAIALGVACPSNVILST